MLCSLHSQIHLLTCSKLCSCCLAHSLPSVPHPALPAARAIGRSTPAASPLPVAASCSQPQTWLPLWLPSAPMATWWFQILGTGSSLCMFWPMRGHSHGCCCPCGLQLCSATLTSSASPHCSSPPCKGPCSKAHPGSYCAPARWAVFCSCSPVGMRGDDRAPFQLSRKQRHTLGPQPITEVLLSVPAANPGPSQNVAQPGHLGGF